MRIPGAEIRLACDFVDGGVVCAAYFLPFGRLLDGLGGECTLWGASVDIVTVIERDFCGLVLAEGVGRVGVYLSLLIKVCRCCCSVQQPVPRYSSLNETRRDA